MLQHVGAPRAAFSSREKRTNRCGRPVDHNPRRLIFISAQGIGLAHDWRILELELGEMRRHWFVPIAACPEEGGLAFGHLRGLEGGSVVVHLSDHLSSADHQGQAK